MYVRICISLSLSLYIYIYTSIYTHTIHISSSIYNVCFLICACHPCAGAMPIFSAALQFRGIIAISI